MILSQKDQPGVHATPVDIAHEPNINRQSVSPVLDQELGFHPPRKRKVQKFTDLNIERHMLHSIKLLSNFTQKAVHTAFFSHEKIFEVKKLYNSQNDGFYVLKKMKKVEVPYERLFCEIEAVISKAGKTSIIFC